MPAPTLRKLTGVFLRIGNTTFGGGLPTIAALQRELVDGNHWLSLEDYALAFSLARITPGTNVIAFCAAPGARIMGLRGALAATLAETGTFGRFGDSDDARLRDLAQQRVGDGGSSRDHCRRGRHDVGQHLVYCEAPLRWLQQRRTGIGDHFQRIRGVLEIWPEPALGDRPGRHCRPAMEGTGERKAPLREAES